MAEEESNPRIVDRTERNAATSFRDHASGPPVEQPAVTGRPNDNPIREPEPAPLGGNSTFAERAKARGAQAKAVSPDEVEDKSVGSAERKSRRKSR